MKQKKLYTVGLYISTNPSPDARGELELFNVVGRSDERAIRRARKFVHANDPGAVAILASCERIAEIDIP